MITRHVATLILYDKHHKILMQHRSDDAPRLAGYWGMFGGGIEEGETPEQALRREIMEEIEYTMKKPEPFCTDEFDEEGGENDVIHVIAHNFIEKYDEVQPIVQHEGQGFGWFTVGEALKLKVTSHRHETLIRVREFLAQFSKKE